MKRLPMKEEEARSVPGIMLERNPGVSAIWVVRRFEPFEPEVGGKGRLMRIDPQSTVRLECWAEGRPATKEEIEHSVLTGLPHIIELAIADDVYNGNTAASEMLARSVARGFKLLGLPATLGPAVEGLWEAAAAAPAPAG